MNTDSGESLHWVFSDLQFLHAGSDGMPLQNAVDDILEQGLPLRSVWLLGDIAYGTNAASLREATMVIPKQLARVNAPVYYILGNHEIDYFWHTQIVMPPLYGQVRDNDQWHVPELDRFYFTETFDETLVVFMGDHIAKDGRWATSGGDCASEFYPYSAADYQQLRNKMAAHNGPVVMASHYALPGGQRASKLLRHLLPLPENVRTHLYGHAHIGDLIWNKERPWQRENPVEGSSIRQFNISALEPERSPGSHSAILTLGPNGPRRLRIRCSQKKQWVEEFLLPAPSETL